MNLTRRETGVLSLIAQGMTDREIARQLEFSFSTARKYRENLLAKSGLKKSSQLVVKYFVLFPDALKQNGGLAHIDPCSPREREVLNLLASGLSDKQIARALGISNETARKHRRHLLNKTASPNVLTLLCIALMSGWLGDPARLLPVNAG
ncbi:regulatory LuxR family protein [Paraburkholderia rhizosphaerae]|uniref:Regulatory LuxR family protein n=1 Tax=Paraburkholderia rhizosphaerae TaxID=480658 RepID=A0A4R8LNP1_9BURK|nr:regulatory LuxR family protein [Paraburkholderia rhizosphaerae]